MAGARPLSLRCRLRGGNRRRYPAPTQHRDAAAARAGSNAEATAFVATAHSAPPASPRLGRDGWDRPDLLSAARDAADFVLRELRLPDGSLAHVWRDGRAEGPAFLEDVAAMALACFDLADAGEGPRWAAAGAALGEQMAADFADALGAVCYRSGARHEALFARQKDLSDGPVPSGAALAAQALIRLRRQAGDGRWDAAIDATLGSAGAGIERAPTAFSGLLTGACALSSTASDPPEPVGRPSGRSGGASPFAARRPDPRRENP